MKKYMYGFLTLLFLFSMCLAGGYLFGHSSNEPMQWYEAGLVVFWFSISMIGTVYSALSFINEL